MFLQELKMEQRDLFLDLCIAVSSSDNEFSNSEKGLIKQLCAEMMIKERYQIISEIDKTIDKLAEMSTQKEKRIMLIELAGIILVDGKYVEEEKEFIDKIGEKFSVPSDDIEKMMKIVLELYGVYGKIGAYLNGETV
ncbi:MAG: hypothetical protein J5590_05205 [Clostridia bacterium]|nr:hypothetical protein [Clostridia bacterium]